MRTEGVGICLRSPSQCPAPPARRHAGMPACREDCSGLLPLGATGRFPLRWVAIIVAERERAMTELWSRVLDRIEEDRAGMRGRVLPRACNPFIKEAGESWKT
jgi:hypothetical protein